MVDLLKKNPAVAVPVILARLKQKDEEWCAQSLPTMAVLRGGITRVLRAAAFCICTICAREYHSGGWTACCCAG